ncbi:MAG: CpaD family pilus assembly protein, partial [Allosphingosinicella sp.]
HQLEALNNPSLYSVHQPVVQRTDFVFDVATGPGGVPATEQARLNAWFVSIDLDYGDTITVDEPVGYESAEARSDVASVAGRYGLLLGDGSPMTAGQVQPGTIRIIASRATASVPGCPAWNGDNIAPVNNTSPNYGCATNSNLAAMIANPDDLVVGQDGSGLSNAGTASRAIRVYRERTPTGQQPLPATSTTGGN